MQFYLFSVLGEIMNSIKLVFACVFCFFIQHQVQAGDFYIGLGLGFGDVDIEREFFPEVTSLTTDSNSVLVTDALIGYEFDNGFFVDLGIESYDTINLLAIADETDLNTTRLGLGYVIPSESRFKFYGKTGINFWQLELTESIFLNPGPEAMGKRSGEDLFLQIGTEYHFNDRFRLGLSYDYSNNDFGETTGGKVTMKWFP